MHTPLPVHKLALLMALALPTTKINAQAAPAWTATPGGSISWIRTTSTGNLLACTSEGLKGIDPATGTATWTVMELANAPESGYEEIANTPFVSLVPAGADDQLAILEPFGGTVLFSSKESGINHIASK